MKGIDDLLLAKADRQAFEVHQKDKKIHISREELNKKVDREIGKELSSNDFTDDLKEKLENLDSESTVPNFEIGIPMKIGEIGGKDIIKNVLSIENPSLQDTIDLPFLKGAKILNFFAQYEKLSESIGGVISISRRTVETPQGRYNIEIIDVQYRNQNTDNYESIESFKADLVENNGVDKKVLNWSKGSTSLLNLDLTSAKSYKVIPKKVEVTPDNYRLATTHNSLLSFSPSNPKVNGYIKYDEFNSEPLSFCQLDLKTDANNNLDISELYADTKNLLINIEYFK